MTDKTDHSARSSPRIHGSYDVPLPIQIYDPYPETRVRRLVLRDEWLPVRETIDPLAYALEAQMRSKAGEDAPDLRAAQKTAAEVLDGRFRLPYRVKLTDVSVQRDHDVGGSLHPEVVGGWGDWALGLPGRAYLLHEWKGYLWDEVEGERRWLPGYLGELRAEEDIAWRLLAKVVPRFRKRVEAFEQERDRLTEGEKASPKGRLSDETLHTWAGLQAAIHLLLTKAEYAYEVRTQLRRRPPEREKAPNEAQRFHLQLARSEVTSLNFAMPLGNSSTISAHLLGRALRDLLAEKKTLWRSRAIRVGKATTGRSSLVNRTKANELLREQDGERSETPWDSVSRHLPEYVRKSTGHDVRPGFAELLNWCRVLFLNAERHRGDLLR